jgi:hypothetical protein
MSFGDLAVVGYEDVVGDEDEYGGMEVEGDVLGDVLGARRPRRLVVRKKKPNWRGQLAPGVAQPGYGLEQLPLTPSLNGGVFTPAFAQMTFSARPQAPFRGERLLVTVRRNTEAAGVIILGNGVFVGRQLQQVELGEFDVEQFAPTAFGVRLFFVQATPGMLVQIQCRANPVVPTDGTVAVSMQLLGHTAR